MRTMICEECKNGIALIKDINCRVKYHYRSEDEMHIEIGAVLGVYCARCGKENEITVKHYFSKDFANVPTKFLVDIALSESGRILDD